MAGRTVNKNADVTFRAHDKVTPVTKKMGAQVGTRLPAEFKKGTAAMRGFDAAGTQVSTNVLGRLSPMLAGLSTNMALLGVAAVAATAAMAKGFWNLASSAADAGDEIFDLSVRFGVAAETISRLKFVAEQSGASIETIGNAMKTMSKNVVTGSVTFKKWGVDLEKGNGELRTTEELFFAAIERINEFENPVLQAAAAQDIFGRSGAELLQVIKLGSDGIEELMRKSDEYGATISEKTAKQANAFNNEIHASETAVNSLWRVIGEDLMPMMEGLTVAFGNATNWIRGNEVAMTLLTRAMDIATVGSIPILKAIFDDTEESAEDLDIALVGLADDAPGAASGLAMVGDNAKQAEKHAASLAKGLERARRAYGQWAMAFGEDIEAMFEQQDKDLFAARFIREKNHQESLVDLEEWKAAKVAGIQERESGEREAHRAQEIEAQREMADRAVAAAVQIGESIGSSMALLVTGAIDAEEAFKRIASSMITTLIAIVQRAIMVYAAEAAAAAFVSQAAIPIVGPILGAAAAAAALGFVGALVTEMAAGGEITAGMVRGGTPYRDTVPVIAQRGEGFLSRDEVKHIRKLTASLERGGDNGGHTTVYNITSVGTIPTPELMRATRQQDMLLRRLDRRRRS